LQTAIERDQLAKAERLREDLKQEQAHLKQQREHLNRLLEEAQ
jgi:F0F1-type ATP synthase membrane subunit b/b'